jgi:predicted membrane protein
MPHEVVWYVASGLVLMDGGYLLLYYFATSCCENIKNSRVLYLPFLAATAMSVVIQVYTVAFTGSFSFILGWNFSLAFSFSMSFSFNAFGVIFSILSVLEQLSLFVMIGKQIRKQNAEQRIDEVKDAVDKVENTRVKGANLLESTVLGAKKHTENNRAEDAI